MYMDRNKSFLSTLNASNNVNSNEGWRATLNIGSNQRFFKISGNTVLSQDIYEEEKELVAKEQFCCGVSEELLQDYVDNELDELTAHRVERHVDVCKKCGPICKELIDLKSLARSLNDARPISPEIQSRLRSKLIVELNININSESEDDIKV